MIYCSKFITLQLTFSIFCELIRVFNTTIFIMKCHIAIKYDKNLNKIIIVKQFRRFNLIKTSGKMQKSRLII
jgi:hypothetical protein